MKKLTIKIIFTLLFVLSIMGTINVIASDFIFKITSFNVKDKSDGVTVNNVSLKNNDLINDVIFTKENDYIKYNITIKNTSKEDYTIKSIKDNNSSDYLEYKYEDLSNSIIKANEDKTFELEIKYIKETTNLNILNNPVNLELTYSTNDGEEKKQTIVDKFIINPKTGDKIILFLIIGSLSLAVLLYLFFGKHKGTKIFVIFSLLNITCLPFVVKASNDLFIISLKNDIKEKEYVVTFNSNVDYTMKEQIVVRNNKVERPREPYIEGYYIDDFYTDPEFKTVFDFDNTSITDTTTLYVHFITACERFEKDSWDTIRNNLNNNPNYYPVGCTKTIEAPNFNGVKKQYPLRLVNTSRPEVCNTPGYSQTACGTVIEFLNIVDYRGVDPNNYVAEGWKGTDLVSFLNGEFYNNLPDDLKSVIIPTYPIVSGYGPNGISENITAQDTDKNLIYLYSPREVGLDGHYDNKDNVLTDTRTIDYYALDNTDETRRKKSLRGGYDYWWLRSARLTFTGSFCAINNKGAHTSTNANVKWGVVPVFRIG